jgi:hypothetical protein
MVCLLVAQRLLIMPQIHQHIITIFFYIAVGALSFNRTVSLLSKH